MTYDNDITFIHPQKTAPEIQRHITLMNLEGWELLGPPGSIVDGHIMFSWRREKNVQVKVDE